MELGTCLFDFSGVSLKCNELLLELLHELDNDLRSHGQASVFPTRAVHYPIFLLGEEEHRLNLARKDTATTEVASDRMLYAGQKLSPLRKPQGAPYHDGNVFTNRLFMDCG